MIPKIVPIFAIAAAFIGCTISSLPTGPVQYDSRVIERDASQSAHISLNMGAGDLKVSSGTEKFLRAYFTYNVPQLKPDSLLHRRRRGHARNRSAGIARAHRQQQIRMGPQTE
jgi:hypothetical protein